MPLIVVVSGSPAPGSRSLAVGRHVGAELSRRGFGVASVDVRDLPPASLLGGRVDDPAIEAASTVVERADGVVLITPVYKASYSGALKAFLDVLPQAGLARKVVLPIAVGGTLAHVLAIDYALRPVLATMGGPQVLGALFLLDTWLARASTGEVSLEHADAQERLASGIEQLDMALLRGGAAATPCAAPASAPSCTETAIVSLSQ